MSDIRLSQGQSHRYCQFCGHVMQMLDEHLFRYDRATGIRYDIGDQYLTCQYYQAPTVRLDDIVNQPAHDRVYVGKIDRQACEAKR